MGYDILSWAGVFPFSLSRADSSSKYDILFSIVAALVLIGYWGRLGSSLYFLLSFWNVKEKFELKASLDHSVQNLSAICLGSVMSVLGSIGQLMDWMVFELLSPQKVLMFDHILLGGVFGLISDVKLWREDFFDFF